MKINTVVQPDRRMPTRRNLLIMLGVSALAAPFASFAQQQPGKTPQIAYLSPVVPQEGSDWRLNAFLEGMRELGYIDGKNMRMEVRWGEGKLERLPALAAELVQLKVDVIVAVTAPSVRAAIAATRSIPIVMPVSSDPVAEGLIASLARPGGNITGLSVMAPELGGKRLQLLKEIVPKVTHPVAVLWNPDYVGMRARYQQAEAAAPSVGIAVRSVEARDVTQLEEAFIAIAREQFDGLVLLADPLTINQRTRIVAFATEKRLPAIYESAEFVDAGGLVSYGPSLPNQYRRAATYVDKILKGAKPGDIPVEQPTKFELVINMKTAKALGIKIPNSILLRADRVIE